MVESITNHVQNKSKNLLIHLFLQQNIHCTAEIAFVDMWMGQESGTFSVRIQFIHGWSTYSPPEIRV